MITDTTDLMTDFDLYMLRICEIMDEKKLRFFNWEFHSAFVFPYSKLLGTSDDKEAMHAYRSYFLQWAHGGIKLLQKTVVQGLFLSAAEFSSSFHSL